jgi:AraC-like DNA-binding protein
VYWLKSENRDKGLILAFDKSFLETKLSILYLKIFINKLNDLGEGDTVDKLHDAYPWLQDALDSQQEIKVITYIRISNFIKNSAPPEIGLMLGSNIPISGMGMVSDIVMSTPMLKMGLDKILTYFYEDLKAVHVFTRSTPTLYKIYFNMDVPISDDTFRFFMDIVLSAANQAASFFTQSKENFSYVCLRAESLPYDKVLIERQMNCPVRLGCVDNYIAMPLAIAELPSPISSIEMFERACKSATENSQIIKNSNTLVGQAEAAIRKTPDKPWVLDDMAAIFNMSVSTFRRKLKQQNTSFKLLLSDVRFDLAKERLVKHDDRVDDIAQLLGFSDASNFSASFKRWSGFTPSEYRKIKREALK